jgi:anti-sigma28 factor (negative regulator of flagellin synthesis)
MHQEYFQPMASNINNLNGLASPRLDQIARSTQDRPARAAAQPAAEAPRSLDRTDRVELSAEALNAEGVRTDLVARVRAEILAGTYVTDDKLDSAVNALAKDLGI